MRTLINNIIRLVALLSVVSLIAMLMGWQNVDMIAIAVDVVMLAIWISTEYEIRGKGKDSPQR